MSTTLATVDMTGRSVGDTGQININTPATMWDVVGHYGEPAHVRILNESGCGLKIWTDTNVVNEFIGAGGWQTWEIDKGTNYINWQVFYVMSNAQVNILLPTFYKPGETVPATAVLGNSPIGGSTNTTAVGNSLSNEGNSAQTLIVDIGQVGNTNQIKIFSDGSFVWNVLQAGVSHQILKGQITGDPLQLGQAGDITDMLSSLLFINGANNAKLSVDVSGNFNVDLPNGTRVWQFNSGGANLSGGITAGGSMSAHDLFATAGVNASIVNSNGYTLGGSSGNYALYTNSLSRLSIGAITSTGALQTISHGLGSLPNSVIVWGNSHTSTTTMGSDTYTTTQFDVLGAAGGVPIGYEAKRF